MTDVVDEQNLPLDKTDVGIILSDYLPNGWDGNMCQDLLDMFNHKANRLLIEAENKGGIKALSHVLVYGATGRKHIGLSRTYTVSYLADLQGKRAEIWDSKPKAALSKQLGDSE